MAKVTLTDLTSLSNDTSATNSINTNFQTIEDYINDNVLSRDTGAETNIMLNALDMNSNDITNAGTIVADDITLSGTNLSTQLAEAAASAAESAGYASDSSNSAAAALVSENNAAASEAAAAASEDILGQINAYTASSGTSFTPDFSTYANFHYTLTANATINSPSNESVGTSGVIAIIQGGTGSNLVTWGTDYEFTNGVAPTLSTTLGAIDLVPYYVYASDRILCGNLLVSFA